MSTLTVHPIEYLKLHSHLGFGVICKRSLAWLVTCGKQICDLAEQMATVAVVFLTVGLIVIAFMQISEAALVTAGFENAITEVLSPLQSLPVGM